MSDHQDAQDYTANGPTNAGFRTNGANIVNGVVASGTQYGVHGIGVGGSGASETVGVVGESESGSGVRGFGSPGVEGSSEDYFGVQGTSTNSRGVQGSGLSAGVYGESNGNKEIPLETSIPIVGHQPPEKLFATYAGVQGESNSQYGIGIEGNSKKGYGAQFSGGLAPLRLKANPTSGPPTHGYHRVGEFYVDVNGDLFYCKAYGEPGSWYRVRLDAV